ncbi:MAG: glycosyltransferase family 9 protein [Gammaproteobacteria bacterium]|nr:glycosyltransferase family 9 protein [Gammaproteobacteria bacterium]
MKSTKKILVIRNDKIGDFMLAWPSFALLKRQYPEAEITALVPRYTAPLAEQCEWIDKVLIDNKQTSFIKDILNLSKLIRINNYDVSISLFSEFRTAISLWLAQVSIRIGPATKLAQVFLNKRVRQKRSRSVKPEYEYNLDLIEYYIKSNGEIPIARPQPPFLTFDKLEITSLKNQFISTFSVPGNSKLIFIHPGTGGSAINLSIEQYAKLVTDIAERNNVYIVITAGPGEQAIAEELSAQLRDVKHHIHYSNTGLIDFCKFIGICDIFISGSTGPLHIAGALDICTVAFYPSKRSATPLRWQTLNCTQHRLAFTTENEHSDGSYQIDLNSAYTLIAEKYLG